MSRIFTLPTVQGLPAYEVALCENHLIGHSSDARKRAANDVPLDAHWTECTDNEMAVCTVCGAIGSDVDSDAHDLDDERFGPQETPVPLAAPSTHAGGTVLASFRLDDRPGFLVLLDMKGSPLTGFPGFDRYATVVIHTEDAGASYTGDREAFFTDQREAIASFAARLLLAAGGY